MSGREDFDGAGRSARPGIVRARPRVASQRVAGQPDNDVDPAHAGAFGRARQAGELDRIGRDVLEPAGILEIEVMMFGGVGVEVGPARIDHHLAQQPGVGELVQGVVDGGERDPDCLAERIAVELLG